MVLISIDTNKCIGCGSCVHVCPVSMYSLKDGKSVMVRKLDECVMCGVCESSCPAGAIKITAEKK